jgi:hypothetical protein
MIERVADREPDDGSDAAIPGVFVHVRCVRKAWGSR